MRFSDGKRSESAVDVAVQRDGRIVVVGDADKPGGGHIFIARLLRNGTLDRSFSRDGRRLIRAPHGLPSYALRVVIRPDGRILVAGTAEGARNVWATFAQVRRHGGLDRSFGRSGVRLLSLAGGETFGSALALDRRGRIVAGGDFFMDTREGSQPWVARLGPRGSLDRTLARRGWRTINFGGRRGDAGVSDLAVQRDGRIVVFGSTFRAPGKGRFAFARLGPRGSLDRSFSRDGRVVLDVARNGANHSGAVELDRQGRIVATGYAFGNATDVFVPVVRLTPRGRPDRSFAGDGRKNAGPGTGEDLAVDPAGRIIIAGSHITRPPSSPGGGTGGDFQVIRLLPTGSFDRGFSGPRFASFANGKRNDRAWALVLQSDGKMLLAGDSLQPRTGVDAAIARFAFR